MKVDKFEDLWIWKEAMTLTSTIYGLFNSCRDFAMKDQILRAAVSIPSNIAEGFDRHTNKEFIHFLYIARGSCAELRTQLYLAVELNLIDKSKGFQAIEHSKKMSGMLFNTIKSRKELL